VKCSYQHAAAITRSAQNCLWHLLTLVLYINGDSATTMAVNHEGIGGMSL